VKINLDEQEIQNALVEYINLQGIDLSNKAVEVTLTAGRGVNGHSAQIDIMPLEKKEGEEGETKPSDEEQQAIKFDFSEAD